MRHLSQAEGAECGLVCLAMVADHYGMRCDLEWFRERFITTQRGVTIKQLNDMATDLGFASRALQVDLENLRHMRTPCVLHWEMKHFVVLAKCGRSGVLIFDPAKGKRRLSWNEVGQAYTGIALELIPGPTFAKQDIRTSRSFTSILGKLHGITGPVVHLLTFALYLELCGLVLPLFSKWVMDDVLPGADYDLFVLLVAAQLLVTLIRSITQLLRSRTVNYLTAEMMLQWGSGLIARLLRLPIPYFEKRSLGDINNRFSSYSAIVRSLTNGAIEMVLDGAMGVLSLIVLYVISPLMAALSAGFLILYVLVKTGTSRRIESLQTENLAAAGRSQTLMVETMRGITAIKLNGAEDERLGRHRDLLVTEIGRFKAFQDVLANVALANFLVAGTRDLLITAAGIHAVLTGGMTLGTYVAVAAYSSAFSARTMTLIDKLVEVKMLRVHLDRIADITETPAEFPDEKESAPSASEIPSDAPTLEFRNVFFRYADGEPWILNDLSLTIGAGEVVAITGASGVGKTTLLKLILGIYSPIAGVILVDGLPLARFGIRRLRAMAGTVLQDDALFSGNIAENIAFFDPDPDMDRVRQCAAQAAIHDDIAKFPMQYRTRIGDMGSALSGGQRQRVILARALYRQPQLLLLDEATSHLDSHNEDLVNAAMANHQATRVIIAHRLTTIRKAERVICLDEVANAGRTAA
jgi:ATP-binding cassette subfamily B protein RaxB